VIVGDLVADVSARAAATGGGIVLVATPIGNLGDLSPRALATLREADVVCCEDTRRTRQLLTHAGVSGKRLMALHAHNEAARVPHILSLAQAGETVAVVSDAGLPGISDPGARLVAAAVDAGLIVTAVPGPNAALAALVVSGLPTDRFCFEGFLPRHGARRRRRLAALAAEDRTVVLHEAPGRLVATLADLAESCGPDRLVAVARELTKLHEEVWRGTLAQACEEFASREVRGEIVVVMGGAPAPPSDGEDGRVIEALGRRLGAGDSVRAAATAVAGELGVGRHRAYELALGLRDRSRNGEP
jgi:16S rRNA (cytidine1402-2'-O)-methyltransferase